MSYVTVKDGKLGSVSLPSNPHGHVASVRLIATKQQPLGTSKQHAFPLAMVTLLAGAFGFTADRPYATKST